MPASERSQTSISPVQLAREVFNSYAAMDAPELPEDPQSRLQVELTRWQTKNFGGANPMQMLAGVVEEVGEIAHALLKNDQRVRGFDDDEKFREAAGDAVADAVIFLQQLCTLLRLDFGTLVRLTATEVMQRDWKENPTNAHEWIDLGASGTPSCSLFTPTHTGSITCHSCGRTRAQHPGIQIV